MSVLRPIPGVDRLRAGYERLPGANPWGPRQETLIFAALLAAVALTRLVFLLVNSVEIVPRTDESGYVIIASDFSHWLSDGNAVRGPGYPAFLAIFGADPRPAQMGQIFIELLALSVTLWTAREFWGQVAAATVGVFWLSYGAFAYHDFVLLSDMLNALTVISIGALLLVLWNRRSDRPPILFAAAGALIALQELVRPGSSLVFLLAVALVLVRYGPWRKALTYGALALAAFALLVSPWIYRNFRIYDEPLTTTLNGHVLLLGGVPDRFVREGIVRSLHGLGYRYGHREFVNDRIGMFRHDDLARDKRERKLWREFMLHDAHRFTGEILQDRAERPVRLWLFSPVAAGESSVFKPLKGDALLPLLRAWHAVLVVFAAFALLLLRGLRSATAPWILIVVAATLVSILTLYTVARYSMPYMPFILIWAGVGASSLIVGLRPELAGGSASSGR